MIDSIKGLFLVASGAGGSYIAIVRPWQEQLEWGARMALLVLSIASVIVGLVIAARKKPGA